MNPKILSDRRRGIAKWLMLLSVIAFRPELVTAQVTATLIVRNPMPSQLSTWETDPTLVQLIIVNSGNTAYQNIRASFVVEDLQNNGATVLQSKDDDPSMPRFDIPANTTLTKLVSDIFSVNAVSFNSSYQKTATTTNSIPEGQYEFCVTLIDENNSPITQTGQVCMPFSVFIPDPPTLTFPTDKSTISDIGATAFSWTPVMLGASQVNYQLTIAPVFQNQTPKDAILSNPALLQKTVTVNSYVYTQADPPFSFYPSAVGFAWQVQALDEQNLPVAKNEGKSEVFSFTLPGKTSSSPLLTLEPYYPLDGDTIPWIPPHIIVRFNPYSDSVKQMDYTLNVSGSDNSSFSCHRVLSWPHGPRVSQGWTNLADTDRARYIIADLDFSGNNTTVVRPSWFSSLKRGVKYTWNVSATFIRSGKTITASTGNRSFWLGATSPILDSPSNNSVIDSASQPVKLTWHNNRPDSLNPNYFVGMGSSLKASSFKGVASELWRLEMSHDSTFAVVDTTDSLRIPSPPDSTGGNATGLYQSRSFTPKVLPPGKYWWRVSWIDNGAPYLKGGPWAFTIVRDTSQQKKKNESNTTNCGGKYIAAAPSDKNATGNTFSVGQQISIGFFRLNLTRVTSASGTNLSGEGTITVPYLHAPIIVEFTGLKVNAESEVIGGSATAKIDPNAGISSTLANQLGDLGLNNSDITSVMKVANEAQKLVSALSTSTPVTLPIGLDNDIQGFPMTIGLMGMTFTDTLATLNAVASFPLPDLGPNVGLGVGARGIPFQPAGLGFSQGTLYLAKDLGYAQTGSFGFKFKAAAKADSGTYVTWDCNGFKELRLRADVIFPREWLTPLPDTGGQVAAHLLADIRKPGDWLAAATMDSCQIAGGSGMVLSVKDMIYDHSDVQNPAGIVFPSNYPKASTGVDWHGFYIRSATITLPKDLQTFKGSPPKISVNNMIIDGMGFTATLLATNVIQYPEGNFGQWGASLDSIGVKFACSSLTNGWLSGRIQIPISDSALAYSATLSLPQKGGTKFIFNIHPTSELKADIWFATLNLDPTSSIVVADTASKFFATATLNGNFSINGSVGDLPKIDLQALKFQGFTLTTNSPYIKAGTWEFASPQHSMSGFPISISDVGIATAQRKNGFGVGLKFNVSANIADVISGETALSIWAVINPTNNTGQKFAFDGVDVDTIKVNADLGAVQIDGSIALYHDDPTFGNGFKGMLDATFIKTVEVSAVAQFGSVNGYRYWYVDASAVFDAGISFGPVAMYGIGGGAWYHMSPGALPSKIDSTPAAPTKPGSSLSGMTFTPDVSSDLGFLANAVVGVSGRPQVFVCSVKLGADFVNGGIGDIFLNGNGYILASESSVTDILSKQDATVLANAKISYDFTKSIFEGDFSFQTGGSINSVFSAQGQMNIHFDPQNWHVLIGIPTNRIKLTLLSLAQVDAYVMAGTDIPAPDLSQFPHKDDIEKAIGGQPLPVASRPLTGGPASGFAMGASFNYSGDFTFAVFYAHMAFGMGFDIAVVNEGNVICSNTNAPPGVNGWFGYGQLFAYADFQMGIKVDMTFVKGNFPILDMGAGALCQFQAPNPIWVQGIVGGHFSILGGLVEGHAAFTFEIGQKCEVLAESPLKIDLFTAAAPDNGSSNVDVFGTPSLSIRFPIDKEVDLQTLDANGQTITKSYRISFESFKISTVNGNASVPGHPETSQDGYTEYFVSDLPLPQTTQLRMDAEVQGFELDSLGQWIATKDSHGDPIVQDTTIFFTTGQLPDSIETKNVSWSIPMDGEKYFLYGEQSQGAIYLNIDRQDIFSHPGKYIVRFLPVNGGTSIDVPLTYDQGSKAIAFPLTGIQPSTEYALQVIRQSKEQFIALSQNLQVLNTVRQTGNAPIRRGLAASLGPKSIINLKNGNNSIVGLDSLNIASPKFVPPGLRVRANEKLLYVLYFQTSKHATLADKISQLKPTGVSHSQYWEIHEDLVASFGSDEGWDDYDIHGFTKLGRNSNDNQQADPLILVDAVETGQSWFTNFAKRSIYDHIFDLAIRGLWDPSATIADGRVYGQASWTHPAPEAVYVSSSTGKIYPPYGGTTIVAHSIFAASQVSLSSTLSRALTGSDYAYTLQVKYLHGTDVPTDFTSLYFTSMRILNEYYSGGADDDNCEIYGKGDWIQNNLWWMQKLGSQSVFNYTSLYSPMYQDNYTIDFAYSPKFDWNANGPWVSLNFTYGNPTIIRINNSLKSVGSARSGAIRIIRH